MVLNVISLQDSDKPLAHVHFTAEGEVSFKSILYIPKKSPNDMFQNYGKVSSFKNFLCNRACDCSFLRFEKRQN